MPVFCVKLDISEFGSTHTENYKLLNLLSFVTYGASRCFCSSRAYLMSVVLAGELGQWVPADNFCSFLHLVC